MGADASTRDPQPKLPELQRLLPIRSAFPAHGGAENWAVFCDSVTDNFRVSTCRFSGSQGVGVYLTRRAACRIQSPRIVARRLQERLGQPVVLENRPGANGGIAAAALVNTPADGYTFMVSDGAILSINRSFTPNLLTTRRMSSRSRCLRAHRCFLAVHSKVPVGTMKEFIEYVKARPGQLN